MQTLIFVHWSRAGKWLLWNYYSDNSVLRVRSREFVAKKLDSSASFNRCRSKPACLDFGRYWSMMTHITWSDTCQQHLLICQQKTISCHRSYYITTLARCTLMYGDGAMLNFTLVPIYILHSGHCSSLSHTHTRQRWLSGCHSHTPHIFITLRR